MPIQEGDRVWLDYIVTLPNGAVMDTSVREVAEEEGLLESGVAAGESFEPLSIVVGEGSLFEELDEDELIGLEEGDVETAYAELRDEVPAEYDRKEFRAMVDAEPEPGQTVEAADGATGTVTTVDDDKVLVDFSHGLGGEPLEIQFRVRRVE